MSSNQPQPAAPPEPSWHWDQGSQSGQQPGQPSGRQDGQPSGQRDGQGTGLPPAPGLGAPSRQPELGGWARFKRWAFSNLNLNGQTPPRVQPAIGEWGPVKVPTTRQKKRMRIFVLIALPLAMLACFLLGWFVYYEMTGCYGFGFGCRKS